MQPDRKPKLFPNTACHLCSCNVRNAPTVNSSLGNSNHHPPKPFTISPTCKNSPPSNTNHHPPNTFDLPNRMQFGMFSNLQILKMNWNLRGWFSTRGKICPLWCMHLQSSKTVFQKDLSNTDLHSATDFWTCYDSETAQPIRYMWVFSHRQDASVKANWINTKWLNLGIQDVWYKWERNQVSSPSCKSKRQLPTQAGLLYIVKIQ